MEKSTKGPMETFNSLQKNGSSSFEQIILEKSNSESVDFNVITGLRSLDEGVFQELVEKLVTQFLETTPIEMLNLRQSIIQGDSYYKNMAYSLKLTCAGLGAKRMVRLLDIIEQGRTSLNSTLQLVDGLEEEFFNVYKELRPFSSWNNIVESDT